MTPDALIQDLLVRVWREAEPDYLLPGNKVAISLVTLLKKAGVPLTQEIVREAAYLYGGCDWHKLPNTAPSLAYDTRTGTEACFWFDWFDWLAESSSKKAKEAR